MKLLTNRTGGRLANQLYFVLQAYCNSDKYKDEYKYIQIQTLAKKQDLSKYCKKLNIEKYFYDITNEHENKSIEIIEQPFNQYYQFINKDFSVSQLDFFIKNTILKSDYFYFIKNKINDDLEQTCSIHIRNGDFINLQLYDFFDRKVYIKNAINFIPKKINTIRIFSDDINACKQYEDILKSRFDIVEFENSDDQLDDLFKLSCYKYKILWNSTFSYWSAFISDVIYNNENIICCPAMTLINEPAELRCKEKWIKI